MEYYLHNELTAQIIKAFYTVYNELGYGFLEKVYENALVIELKKMRLNVRRQYPIKVYYKGEIVGDFFADNIVDNKVIIELKSVKQLLPVHEAQLINYLKATDMEIGLLLNFGDIPEIRRKIFRNY